MSVIRRGLLQTTRWEGTRTSTRRRLVDARGEDIPVFGEATVEICLGDFSTLHTFVEAAIRDDVVLGMDFLEHHRCIVDLRACRLSIAGVSVELEYSSDIVDWMASLRRISTLPQGPTPREEVREAADSKPVCGRKDVYVQGVNLATAQREDPDLKPLIHWKETGPKRPAWKDIATTSPLTKSYWEDWDALELTGGLLCRRWEEADGRRHRRLPIVPKTLQKEVLRQFHDHSSSRHPGKMQTFQKIREHVYWKRCRSDVRDWCRRCHQCAASQRPRRRQHRPMEVPVKEVPRRRVPDDAVNQRVPTAKVPVRQARSYPQGGAFRVTRAVEADAQPEDAVWLWSTRVKAGCTPGRVTGQGDLQDGASRLTTAIEADVHLGEVVWLDPDWWQSPRVRADHPPLATGEEQTVEAVGSERSRLSPCSDSHGATDPPT